MLMSNKVVESLTKRDIKRDNLSPKIIESQLTAVRDLIQVNRDQLSTHGIETVVLSSKLKPTSRYDAYFEFDDFRGIINLTSIGLLADRRGGLFLTIYYNDKKVKGYAFFIICYNGRMSKDQKKLSTLLSTEAYKGVRDFFPADMAIEKKIFDIWRNTVEKY